MHNKITFFNIIFTKLIGGGGPGDLMNEPRIVVIIMKDGCSRSIGKRISVTPHLASIKDFLKSLCRPNLTFAG
jgi:hypothetical protein